MLRRIVIPLVLALVAGGLASPAAATAAQPVVPRGLKLSIVGLVAGQKVTAHEWGEINFTVRLTENKKLVARSTATARAAIWRQLEEARCTVRVDGKECPFRVLGGENGSDASSAFVGRTLGVRLGSGAGKKTIEVRLAGLVARAVLDYRPVALLAFAGLSDREAILGENPPPVTWLALFVDTATLSLSLNDLELPAPLSCTMRGDGLIVGELPAAALHPGLNTLRLSAKDRQGASHGAALRLVCCPRGEMPFGETFVLALGPSGSRSGPFHRVEVSGAAVRLMAERVGQVVAKPESDSGPVGSRLEDLAELVAVEPGTTTVRVLTRSHFTAAWEAGQPFALTVPAPVVAVTPAQIDQVFEPFYCEDNFFRCQLPKLWNRIEDPTAGRLDRIYGIELYRRVEPRGALVRLAVHFYRRTDNRDIRKPEDFIAMLTSPGPLQIEGEAHSTVTETTLAGRRAKCFRRLTYDFLRPSSLDPGKIAMEERYIVLPGDDGFYVLRYKAPVELAAKYEDVFARVVSSFTPLERLAPDAVRPVRTISARQGVTGFAAFAPAY